jgi:SagB-type dehydrogenase family enzyme
MTRGCLRVFLPVLILAMPPTEPALAQSPERIQLPEPDRTGSMSLERTLDRRRSVRTYTDAPLSLREVSQLLWAAQGLTHPSGYRTAPSAGALYPLDLYLTGGRIIDLPDGVYHYRPRDHVLVRTGNEDRRADLAAAALNQSWVRTGAVVIAITGVYERSTRKYGDRGLRYTHIEVGHAAQNLYLQAEALDLGTVMVGAFNDGEVRRALGLSDRERPLALLPVGRPRP